VTIAFSQNKELKILSYKPQGETLGRAQIKIDFTPNTAHAKGCRARFEAPELQLVT